jgi:hypothetical protein
MSAYRNGPPQAGESEHGWRWAGWLRSWFDDAREMMSSHMPAGDTVPMDMDLESPHERREQAMRQITRMRDERARLAVARMGADEASAVVAKLDALVGMFRDGVQDTPEALLGKMLDHSLLQDYERRFDDVMKLSEGGHH